MISSMCSKRFPVDVFRNKGVKQFENGENRKMRIRTANVKERDAVPGAPRAREGGSVYKKKVKLKIS